jgi:hypothetical protein
MTYSLGGCGCGSCYGCGSGAGSGAGNSYRKVMIGDSL